MRNSCCPKVCHDELVCKCGKGKCIRNKDCCCQKKKKCCKDVKRPCKLPCKVKDQIHVLRDTNKNYCPCSYECLPVTYDPAKMYKKCYFNCCNDCKECEKPCDDCPKCDCSSSSSSSSSECLCEVNHEHKPCSCKKKKCNKCH